MSIRTNTPCDCDGFCPYDATYNSDCEFWCGCDSDADYEPWKEDIDSEQSGTYMQTLFSFSAEEIAHVLIDEANENYADGDISFESINGVISEINQLMDKDELGFSFLLQTLKAITFKHRNKWL